MSVLNQRCCYARFRDWDAWCFASILGVSRSAECCNAATKSSAQREVPVAVTATDESSQWSPDELHMLFSGSIYYSTTSRSRFERRQVCWESCASTGIFRYDCNWQALRRGERTSPLFPRRGGWVVRVTAITLFTATCFLSRLECPQSPAQLPWSQRSMPRSATPALQQRPSGI
jgi:hypothetical protein